MELERNRDFKGVWIPKEIWLNTDLTMTEKVILTEIDSLDAENHCTAGNDYLAEFCQCSVSKVTNAIKKLTELGYIEIISFDGRYRKIKSCLKQKDFEPKPKAEQKESEPNKKKREIPEELKPEEKKATEDKPKRISRKDQFINYINALDFNDTTKDFLCKWVFNTGLNRGVTIEQLKAKLEKLDIECNGDEDLMQKAIETAYLNSYLGFFKPNNSSYKKPADAAAKAAKDTIQSEGQQTRPKIKNTYGYVPTTDNTQTKTIIETTTNGRKIALAEEVF